MIHQPLNRRRWLAGVGASSLLARFGWMNSLAQTATPDYKALVCIFLAGGNDGHNTVVPLQQTAYNAYRAARGGLALPDSNGALLQVATPDDTPYGLHPGLVGVHPHWAGGRLAVLANVGMLVQPTTRAQFLANTVPVPTNLFSHSHQTQQMQAGNPNRSGGTGWGGTRRRPRPTVEWHRRFSHRRLDCGPLALLHRQHHPLRQPLPRLQP